MLRLLSDLKLVQRLEFDATAGLLASGFQGSWVTYVGASNNVDLTTATATKLAWPVWNENELGNTGGGAFSPDVEELQKVTVLYGKHRAMTDQYSGTLPVTGEALDVGAGGTLVVGTIGDGTAVALCIRNWQNVVYRGQTYANLVEYVSI